MADSEPTRTTRTVTVTTKTTNPPITTTEELITGTTTTTITITDTPTSEPISTSVETSYSEDPTTTSESEPKPSTSTQTDSPTSPATVTIYATPPPTTESSDPNGINTKGLTTGAKAGIGVGVSIGGILIIIGAIILYHRWGVIRRRKGETGDALPTSIGDGTAPAEMEAREWRVFELPAKKGKSELPGPNLERGRERYELDA
ncbi:hypothetical protein BDW69DRAFT_186241 [Aspergillus filifer]